MTVRVTDCYAGLQSELDFSLQELKTLRRADDFIRLAVAAARRLPGQGRAETGLVLSSAFGPMESNFAVLDQVVAGDAVSPTLFSHSVFNAAAGYIAMNCGFSGRVMTVTDFDLPFFRALELGWAAVAGGVLRRCLVMEVETGSRLLLDACERQVFWPPGVICWLLEAEGDGWILERPEWQWSVNPRGIEDCAILEMEGAESLENVAGKEHVLAAAIELTSVLRKKQRTICCSVHSSSSTVALRFERGGNG